jgi:hypothetical protein
MTLEVTTNAQRLLQRLDDFARIGGTPAGGVDRQALSEEDYYYLVSVTQTSFSTSIHYR